MELHIKLTINPFLNKETFVLVYFQLKLEAFLNFTTRIKKHSEERKKKKDKFLSERTSRTFVHIVSKDKGPAD